MLRLLLIVVVLGLGVYSLYRALVSESGKAEAASAALRKKARRFVRYRFREVPLELNGSRWKIGNAEVSLENLERHVAERGLTGEALDAAIREFFEQVANSPETIDWSDAAPNLLPQLVPDDYHESAPSILRQEFAEGIQLTYVVDLPDRFLFVTTDLAREWGQSAEAIRECAHKNLDARQAELSIDLTPSKGPSEQGAFATVAEDLGYECALLASRSFRERAAALLGTPFLAGVPNRGFLVMWSEDFEHKAGFAERVAHDFGEHTHPISPAVYAVSADGVTLASDLRAKVRLKWN